VLGGCTASRNALSTHDSVCFRVYPEALAAVHDHGRFAGERYLPPHALTSGIHKVAIPVSLKAAARVATCLVAFTGHYTASSVEQCWAPNGPGPVAIVVIRQRDSLLVATVVLTQMPRRLGFAHVFPRLH
jgi:hypothetical protein